MRGKDIILTDILGAAIRNREFQIDKYKNKPIDWGGIYAEAVAHQVHTLIFPIIKKIDPQIGPDEKLMALWNISVISCGIKMICDDIWIGEVIEAFNTVGIKAIVLKGMAINKCYPYPELRTMGDADILVYENDIDRATEILKVMGYLSEKDQKTKHIEFFKKNCISIELHRLLVDYNFMQNVDELQKEVWNKPIEINIGVAKALALSWEMQVLHLCIHMSAHITYGGFGLRQLCDLVMVVETKRELLNWNIVVDKSIKYGIDHFIYAIFLVCNRLFQLQIPVEISCKNERDNEKVDKLIEDILLGANSGKKDKKRTAANVLINNSSNSEALEYKNIFLKAIHILFPNRELMAKRYKYIYVRKSPLLLPFAWIHRIAYGLARKDFNYKDKKAIFKDTELTNIAKERYSLLEWLGLR
ncbi:MAG: nucleotidyltransferase domain-containing protein [Ruminiclostridium sp.]